MTSLVALLLLGVLLGFGGAFVAKALRDGRRGAAALAALALLPVVTYLGWLAWMVLGVGPAMR